MPFTKLFRCNKAQTVRLPKVAEFPPAVRDVVVRRVGQTRVIAPADAQWDDFFDMLGVDLGERVQPATKGREPF